MKFHLYAPNIWESEPLDGRYQRLRVYKHELKNSHDSYYVLVGVGKDLVQMPLGRCETAASCMKMAEEFS